MGQQIQSTSLVAGFTDSVHRFPSRQALVVGEGRWTYEELGALSSSIAAAIRHAADAETRLVALLAHRSQAAYAGVLGILLAGCGYVPLTPRFPVQRLKQQLLRSGTDLLVVGAEAYDRLRELLATFPKPLRVVLLATSDTQKLRAEFPKHRFVASDAPEHVADRAPKPPKVAAESIAYLLFTSGSTGVPKGVPASHRNVTAYVNCICERYAVNENDRFSQHFDLTFDLSVHDMFVCWQRAASLYVVPENALMAPAQFIKNHELTMWFSVPSAMAFMTRVGMLKPGAFPSLRWSLFCGEPLLQDYAQAWQAAAPNSIVENLYGPTEATIAITAYRWDPERSPAKCVNGIVPIGWPFADQSAWIVSPDLQPVPPGLSGELALSGSQVTRGYWNDAEASRGRFVTLSSHGNVPGYLTSDSARTDDDGCLYYLGRTDDQVKIRGHRVELQEIDHVVRRAAGTLQAVAVAWPTTNGSADGVVAFVCTDRPDDESLVEDILVHCKKELPMYMVPRTVRFIQELPFNVNGKIDRKRLIQILDEGNR